MNIVLLGLIVFEKIQLFQEKRKPSIAAIVCAICILCTVVFYAAVCFAGFFMENNPITAKEILNISFGTIIIVADLIIECIFYKRAKKTEKEEVKNEV